MARDTNVMKRHVKYRAFEKHNVNINMTRVGLRIYNSEINSSYH